MTIPDFNAGAELYLGSSWPIAAAQGPRFFTTAARAIRFALEEAAPVSLRGARLTVGTQIFSGRELGALYHNARYPFGRKV